MTQRGRRGARFSPATESPAATLGWAWLLTVGVTIIHQKVGDEREGRPDGGLILANQKVKD